MGTKMRINYITNEREKMMLHCTEPSGKRWQILATLEAYQMLWDAHGAFPLGMDIIRHEDGRLEPAEG